MMKHAISFSMCLRDVHRGLLDPDQIDVFWFGCQSEHVIRTDGLVPFEVSWMNKYDDGSSGGPRRKSYHTGMHGSTGILSVVCDAEALASWQRLLARITLLEYGGWVKWGALVPGTDEPNYWKIAKFLLGRGEEVWLNRRWLTADDAVHA
jgi:hypothetical protein